MKLLRSESTLKEILEARPQFIFAASYSAKSPKELARATRENLQAAISVKQNLLTKAPIVFGSCSHSSTKPFPGSAEAETRLKLEILEDQRVGGSIYIGPISSSIDEMEGMKHVLEAKGFPSPRSILIVTCELHSGSERILSGMVFPHTRAVILCNSHEYEVEPDHPTPDQRTWPRWLWASVKRHLAFKAASKGLVSLDRLRKFTHGYD